MKAVRPRKDLTVVRLFQSEQEVKRYELRAYVQVGTTELGMDFLNVSGGTPYMKTENRREQRMMQSLIAALLMALMLGLTAAPALAVHIECLAGTAACRGTQQADVMAGTLGADKMRGLGSNDTLMALEGEDELYGGRQDDTLRAGDGVDRLLGEVGDDKLHGGQGGDTIFGNGGEDVLYGEGGDDRLVAAPDVSNDRVYCGPGYDTAIVGYNDTPFACEEVLQR